MLKQLSHPGTPKSDFFKEKISELHFSSYKIKCHPTHILKYNMPIMMRKKIGFSRKKKIIKISITELINIDEMWYWRKSSVYSYTVLGLRTGSARINASPLGQRQRGERRSSSHDYKRKVCEAP